MAFDPETGVIQTVLPPSEFWLRKFQFGGGDVGSEVSDLRISGRFLEGEGINEELASCPVAVGVEESPETPSSTLSVRVPKMSRESSMIFIK
jgi:hypothetical protein